MRTEKVRYSGTKLIVNGIMHNAKQAIGICQKFGRSYLPCACYVFEKNDTIFRDDLIYSFAIENLENSAAYVHTYRVATKLILPETMPL